MALTPGARLGSYEILSKLGEGGMGEVYRARDSKLKREVAIKVLPDLLAGDPDRLSRFQREAELLATLNHPNIAAIYGLEDQAIVMELVDGDTLAQKIEGLRAKGSGLPVDEALQIARQIVDALETAHDRGVVHRDLKPANIKVTPDGKVKVLDFGLAKMLESEAPASSLSMSPTISLHATYAGVILGTAAYMSPEQARGKMVDRRTDIWAFGCVVFEMLTGKRIFDTAGDTVSDAIAAVLTKEPDWRALPADTPPHMVALLHRCLQKDPQKRLPHIGVARLEIDEGPQASSAAIGAGAGVPPMWRRAVPAAMAALLTAGLAGAAWWSLRPSSAPPVVTRFVIPLPPGQDFTNAGRHVVALSPDGTRLVYVANQRLYLREISELVARPIPGIDGNNAVIEPVFSPDGNEIAFFSGADSTLKRIAVSGGAPVTIASIVSPYGMHWGTDGIVFGEAERGIFRVAAGGGTPELLAKTEAGEFAQMPQVLPGGKALLFTLAKGNGPDRWDKATILVQPIPTGARQVVFEGGSDARYFPSGHILYAFGGVVFALRFDLQQLKVAGGPVPVIEGVRRAPSGATGAAQFATAGNGALAYVTGPVSTASGARELAIIDRKGVARVLKVAAGNIGHARVSPDGKRAAFDTDDEKESIVWVYDIDGTTAMRRVSFSGRNMYPIWSADGQRLAFTSDREGDHAIFWTRTDGSGPPERLTRPMKGEEHIPESWSPNGDGFLFRITKDNASTLAYYSFGAKSVTPYGGIVSSRPINATFSPDGRWVAYERTTNAENSGQNIYVQPFPATGAIYQVASLERGGYRHPRWSPDGRELFYFIGGAVRMRVTAVVTRPGFAFGLESSVTRPPYWGDSFGDVARQWDVMPDGQHFLVPVSAGQVGQSDRSVLVPEINVTLNWAEELKQRVPVK